MPIVFQCSQRHSLSVDPSAAGKRVRCPVCQEILIAPTPVLAASAAPIAFEPPAHDLVPLIPLEIPAKPVADPLPSPPAAALAEAIMAPSRDGQPVSSPLPHAVLAPPADDDSEPSDGATPLPVAVAAPCPADDDADDSPYTMTGEVAPWGRLLHLSFIRKYLTKKDSGPKFADVKIGLAFFYWQYVILTISLLLIFCGVLLTAAPFPRWIGAMAFWLGVVGHFAAPFAGLTGGVLCLACPKKANTRPLIVSYLVVEIIGLAFTILGACLALTMPPIVSCVAWMITFAGFVLFMVFLQKLAMFRRDDGSADEAIAIIFSMVQITLVGLATTAFVAAMVHWLVGEMIGAGFGSDVLRLRSAFVATYLVIMGFMYLYFQVLFRVMALISTLRARM